MVRPFLLVCFLVLAAGAGAEPLKAYVPYLGSAPVLPGYLTLMQRLGSLTGTEIQVLPDLPPARAKLMLVKGGIDLAIGPVNSVYEDVQDQILQVPTVLSSYDLILVAAGPFPYKAFSDLKGKHGVVRLGSNVQYLLDQLPDAEFETVPQWSSAFKMLLAGRADYLVIGDSGYETAVTTDPEIAGQKGRLVVVPPHFAAYSPRLYVTKTKPDLADRLDRALRGLQDSGELGKILGGR